MRFFSNEAKDNVDEPGTDDRTEQSQPEPAAVPQQRAGSPWQDGPGHTDPPAPQPTAFGASTVGGAVAASAMAGPSEPVTDRTDRTSDAAAGVADDRTVALGDGADRTAALDDRVDRTATFDDGDRTVAFNAGDGTDQGRTVPLSGSTDHDRTVPLGATTAAGDRDAEVAWPAGSSHDDSGRTSDPDGVTGEPVRAHRADGSDGSRRADDAVDAALEDRGGFDDPQLKSRTDEEPGTGKETRTDEDDVVDLPLEDRGTFDDPVVTGEPAPVPVAVPVTTPSPQAEKDQPTGASPFFPASDVTTLKERWRDVQLRFVDDPKSATADAAGLVDEAVDKLTEALKQQRGGLAKGSDDTETLRVELRGYRDILDRLLGL